MEKAIKGVLAALGGVAGAVSLALVSVPVAKAQLNIPPPPVTLPQIQGLDSTPAIQQLAYYILGWLFWGLIIFSVIMVLVAAYRYVTSGGEPEKVRSAGKTLMYAAIGVVVALVASAIPILIGTFFGTPIMF